MKLNYFIRFSLFAFLLNLSCVCNPLSAQDKLPAILENELKREYSVLKTLEIPVYYLAYRVDDRNRYRIAAEFGALTYSDDNSSRTVTITLRVGSAQRDNTHPLRGKNDSYASYSRIVLPTETNAEAIQNILWRATNEAYQDAVSDYSKVKANMSIKIEEEENAADFTLNTPNIYLEDQIKKESIKFNVPDWEQRVKKYSAEFLKDSAIFYGTATADCQINRKYYFSSNGDKVIQNEVSANVTISGNIKARDGMEMPLYKSFHASAPDRLPSNKDLQNSAETLTANLIKLKNAPIAEPFTGPALLSAEASGVFFHEIFGHRVEGQRMKNENDAQTFKKMVGDHILPNTLNVYSIPTQKNYEGIDLKGYYRYDDEGSKAERVNVVENGILKDFLMSRSPMKNFPKTNGHGRAQAGMQPVSRQSNLIIETSDPKSAKELRSELIRMVKEQKATYGYLFQQVLGGFTTTGRYMPSAFNVTPTLVYRVYADGRPDEIVRGVDLIGTPLSMFSQIDMAGGEKGVFNGTCGAESGGVPVSACSPSILVKKIETQKKAKSQERPYILPRPAIDN